MSTNELLKMVTKPIDVRQTDVKTTFVHNLSDDDDDDYYDSCESTPIVSNFDEYMSKYLEPKTVKTEPVIVINDNNGAVGGNNIHSIALSERKQSLDSDSDFSETSTISSSTTNLAELQLLDAEILAEKFSKLGIRRSSFDASALIAPSIVDDDIDDNKPLLIRSTSLRTGKTPPATPGSGKKVVRFADSLGLDFEYVKLISQDELPIVPMSAFEDLDLTMREEISPMKTFQRFSPLSRILVPEFVQPCAAINFYDRVRNQKVCLENCIISMGSGNQCITCIIRVLNISFEKQVLVRHTLNEWETWTDSLASYILNSSDGWSDKFTVTFWVRTASNRGVQPGQRVLFAIRFMANHDEYWDNNMGLNYSLICQS